MSTSSDEARVFVLERERIWGKRTAISAVIGVVLTFLGAWGWMGFSFAVMVMGIIVVYVSYRVGQVRAAGEIYRSLLGG